MIITCLDRHGSSAVIMILARSDCDKIFAEKKTFTNGKSDAMYKQSS